jgi:hypothetical protein
MAEGGLKELKYFVSNTTLVILDLSTYFLKKTKTSHTKSGLLNSGNTGTHNWKQP